jgi:hypothetical protein
MADSNNSTKTKPEHSREDVLKKLAEHGIPEEIIDLLPESVIEELKDKAAKIGVVIIGRDGKHEGDCDCVRLAITDHPDSKDPLGENGLENVDLIITMMFGYFMLNEEHFNSFRRFAMKTARHIGERAGRDDADIVNDVSFYRTITRDNINQMMHWFR